MFVNDINKRYGIWYKWYSNILNGTFFLAELSAGQARHTWAGPMLAWSREWWRLQLCNWRWELQSVQLALHLQRVVSHCDVLCQFCVRQFDELPLCCLVCTYPQHFEDHPWKRICLAKFYSPLCMSQNIQRSLQRKVGDGSCYCTCGPYQIPLQQ